MGAALACVLPTSFCFSVYPTTTLVSYRPVSAVVFILPSHLYLTLSNFREKNVRRGVSCIGKLQYISKNNNSIKNTKLKDIFSKNLFLG